MSHVVVDGAPRPGTRLTLSHWPGTPTPEELWADVSAEIVLNALRRPPAPLREVEAATLDHFDADGLLALALLVFEGLAETHGELAVGAAYAGDFDVIADRPAARVAFALAALHERGVGGALEMVPELLAGPEGFEELWGPEAAAFDAAEQMLRQGAVEIDEHPEVDLAVVRVDSAHAAARQAVWQGAPVHRAVVHTATSCLRVATLAGRHVSFDYRYESWVRLASRRPRLRVDLDAFAAHLQALETDGGEWRFEGAGAITPSLRRVDGGESTIDPESFVSELHAALLRLDAGPPAWDPYAVPVTVPG